MLIKHEFIKAIKLAYLKAKLIVHKKRWNNLLGKHYKTLSIIYVAESYNESDKISLNTLISADYTGFKYCLNICYPEKLADKIHKDPDLPQNIRFLPYKDNLHLNALLNLNQPEYDFLLITTSQVVFHKKWLQKAFQSIKSALKQENIFFGGFSSFNPNDFKLLNTLKESADNEYVIKNGFSFNVCIFPHFLIKEIKNKINGEISAEDFFSFFRKEHYYFTFSKSGYADVHSYDLINIFDKFHSQPNNLSFVCNRVNNEWEKEVYSLPKFKRLMIHINYGGLGDHLFLSHLPRIAKEYNFYREVYISDKSVYRHNDYKKLIWDINPFVDGHSDEMGYYIEFLKFDTDKMNILDHIMQLYGIGDSQLYHEPELYYKPKIKPELSDKIIFDPNYVSDAADNISKEEIDHYFSEHKIMIDFQMEKRNKSVTTKHYTSWLSSTSLEDFCSIIASCKEIYCFATGTATLAAALGKKAHIFYSKGFSPQFLHSKRNTYIKIGQI